MNIMKPTIKNTLIWMAIISAFLAHAVYNYYSSVKSASDLIPSVGWAACVAIWSRHYILIAATLFRQMGARYGARK